MRPTKTRMSVSDRTGLKKPTPPSGDGTPFEPYFRGFNVLTDPEFSNFRDNSGGWYHPDREGGSNLFTLPYLDLDCPNFLLWPDQTCADDLLVGWCQSTGPFELEEPPEIPEPPTDAIAPAIPTGLVAIAGDGQVTLNWAANTEADFQSYRIYQATASGGPYTQIGSRLVTNLTVTGLTNGITYFFKISAVDTSGNESGQSSFASATPTAPVGGDVTPPPVPTGLTATTSQSQAISLNWNDSTAPDFATFRIYRSLTAGGPYIHIANSAISQFLNTGLTNGTTYYYVVSAVDSSGNESAQSSEVSETPEFVEPPPPPPPDLTPPAIPTGLTATAGNTQVILDWFNNQESDLASYRVYRSTASGGPYTQIVSLLVSNYTNTGLVNGTTYFFRVTAVDTSGNESGQSATASATPAAPPGGDVTPPPVPTGLVAIAGDRQITLDWANSTASDFASFRVKRATVSGGPYTLVATVTASNHLDVALTNGTTYYYVVSAVDTSGNESANSSQASATPALPPPPPPPPNGGTGADGFPVYADRAVTINPGDDIDTKINSVAVGTVIGFAAGVHLIDTAGKQFTPRNGEKLVGETDANGVPLAILRGNWNGTLGGTGLASPFTFANSESYTSNVQFLRLMVEKFAPGFQQCAINGGPSWRIHKCWIHDNLSGGVRIASNAICFQSKIYHNGQIGLKQTTGCNAGVFDGCEVFDNNYADWNSTGNEAGGMKFAGGEPTNMVIRNCHFHHNHGAGIWYDFAGAGGVVENNISEFNTTPGIFWELTASGTIKNNIVRRNGGAADIYVANSAGTSGSPIIVENNTVTNNFGTTTDPTTHAEIWLKDDPTRFVRLGWVTVRGNNITRKIVSGKNNFGTGHFGSTTVPPGIVINDNDYFMAPGANWQWLGVAKTWSQWQALGFDIIGSTTTI